LERSLKRESITMIQVILEDLQKVRSYAMNLLDHLDDELWFRQPQEGINHVAWQVGHLAIVEYSLCLKRVRGEKEGDNDLIPVEQYGKLFGKGSTPTPNPADYPAPEEIRAVLNAVHAQVMKETAALSEATLAESCGPPHPMFSTKGDALRFCPKHEMLHVGQVALLRRLFGGESLR